LTATWTYIELMVSWIGRTEGDEETGKVNREI
jgi:hypothetical protein